MRNAKLEMRNGGAVQKMKSTAEYKDGAGKGRIPFSIGQRFNQCFPIQTTTSKKSYAVIGIIPPFVVERRGRKHTAVLADGT